MKIGKEVLSLPPHLSTAWKNITALHVETRPGHVRPVLIVQLDGAGTIEIPDLNQTVIERVFEAHAEFLEEQEKGNTSPTNSAPGEPSFGKSQQMFGVPLRFGVGGMEGFGAALQHDRAQANAPDLPPEILQKIAGISQVLGVEDAATLPQPEPNCNCFHCQIARAIQSGDQSEQGYEEEEEVTDEDLQFRSWDIEQTDDGSPFYSVTDPTVPEVQYTVHLGDPVGCTCGEKDCEHIKAVLRS